MADRVTAGNALLAISLAILLSASVAHAAAGAFDRQDQSTDRQDQSTSAAPQTAPQTAPAPAKVPPPPLFPRHRRGLYLNGQGLWEIDATPQSPPLNVDDPGVPDPGAYEINLTTRADWARARTDADLLHVDANYGLLPHIFGHEIPTQIKFEVPLASTEDSTHPFTTGVGPVATGVKLNVYHNDQSGVGLSVYPQIEFAPDARAVARGLAEAGQTLTLPLLISKEFSDFTLVVNAAVNTPLHDRDRHVTGFAGAGVGLALTRKLAAMIELHGESRFDLVHDRLVIINAGLMRAFSHTLIGYANLGHSLLSDDGLPHTYAGIGLKLLIEPAARKPR